MSLYLSCTSIIYFPYCGLSVSSCFNSLFKMSISLCISFHSKRPVVIFCFNFKSLIFSLSLLLYSWYIQFIDYKFNEQTLSGKETNYSSESFPLKKAGKETPVAGYVCFPRLKEFIISTLGRSCFSRRRSGLLLYSMIIS